MRSESPTTTLRVPSLPDSPAGDGGPLARTLSRLAAEAADIQGVRRADLRDGDWIVARTRNSTYTLAVGTGRTFVVTGGWFLHHPGESRLVGVNGCTWGGSAILTDMIAAPGMYIEFTNGVRTTRVRDVQLMRAGDRPAVVH